ncbi:GNAT family N-acetyltransferase [Streptomyces sp. NPDC046182]|uniref:GNAT family N-acetyltransferase n=1 Tax=Streptomyces sp. NPDC046182 TaxID=3154601 RepID=UPI0034098F72
MIGRCGLMCRIGVGGLGIGCWLHPHGTGRGLARMAAAALAHQGFPLAGIDRIEIHHDAADPACGAAARRLGLLKVLVSSMVEQSLASATRSWPRTGRRGVPAGGVTPSVVPRGRRA